MHCKGPDRHYRAHLGISKCVPTRLPTAPPFHPPHPLLTRYPTRRFTPHLLWTWHFVIWGLIIVAENVAKKAFR